MSDMLGFRPHGVAIAFAVALTAGFLGVGSAAGGDQPAWEKALQARSDALNRHYKLGKYAPAARSVRAYRIRTDRICTTAHGRLDEITRVRDIPMIQPPDRRFLVPADEASHRAYQKAARLVMAHTLPKLRSVPPPVSVRGRFTHLYGLLAQFARGEEAPFSPTEAYWIHQVERERSLYHCTFSLGR